jgi:hypothetical protein
MKEVFIALYSFESKDVSNFDFSFETGYYFLPKNNALASKVATSVFHRRAIYKKSKLVVILAYFSLGISN